ncbi:na+ dependent nucleoside transporter family protein, partial [Vibrio parahaemolyticus V-223/04]
YRDFRTVWFCKHL